MKIMTKKIITVIMIFIPLSRLAAQVSEDVQVLRSTNNNYVQYTSLVRNYDEETNVLMQYGYFTNEAFTDSIKAHSAFMIQNTNTGSISHIVNLPHGYKVNDVRFVTLRKNNGGHEDFCCFCGTRTQYEYTYSTPVIGDEHPMYIEVYSTHGFAGFFSMDEALSPTTSYTAKVRDVENTSELYRMVCYAEERGYYYNPQHVYKDNAVLDIIGLDDTVFKPSCFCRAKFYPNCGGSVRWDNNMRFNNNEVLMDITKTDDYVVTTSHTTTGDSLWIRYSDQEDHHVYGGLQLNDYVNAVDFSSLSTYYCKDSVKIPYFYRLTAAKICQAKLNETVIGFHMIGDGYGGLLSCRYDYSNGALAFLEGAYYKSSPDIVEMVHMPSNNATAYILREYNWPDNVSVLTWDTTYINCLYPIKQFHQDYTNVQSITMQNRNGYEHLLWSGMEVGNPYTPLHLMTQRGNQGGGYDRTCHKEIDEVAQPVRLEHSIREKHLHIGIRYPNNLATYPITYISFTPHDIGKEIICEVKEN